VTQIWPTVEVEGEPYHLGYEHGRQCADRRMWVSRGNPCVAGHHCYAFDSPGVR
jgi:hypothetical protein